MLRVLLLRHFLPLLVLASLGLAALAAATGLPLAAGVLAGSMLALAAAAWLERRAPWRAEFNRDHAGDTRIDLASAAVIVLAVDPLAKALLPQVAGASPAGGWLAASLPRPLEVLAVLLLAEFGRYWAHRLHHRIGALWWLHALHHGSERLHLLNGLRLHPLNHLLVLAMGLLPALALGASADALLWSLAITQPVALVQHANIALRHGGWNRVFSTPEAHRWHHGDAPALGEHNFGHALLLWDHVFGTFRRAEDLPADARIGLYAASRAYPARASYPRQLASMLRAPCCRA